MVFLFSPILVLMLLVGQTINLLHHKIQGLAWASSLVPCSGVVIDGDGNVLVAGHYFVHKFSKDGKFLQQAGGTPGASFSIEAPRAMAIGKGGRICHNSCHSILIQLKNITTGIYSHEIQEKVLECLLPLSGI